MAEMKEFNKAYPSLSPPPYKQTTAAIPATEDGVIAIGQPDVPYKCFFLVLMILHTILSVISGIFVFLAIFVVSLLEGLLLNKAVMSNPDFVKQYPYSIPTEAIAVGSGTIEAIRLLFIALLLIIILVQYLGWKGYVQHHLPSLYAFAVFEGIGLVFLSVIMGFYGPHPVIVVELLIALVYTIIPLKFAEEVSKLRREPQVV